MLLIFMDWTAVACGWSFGALVAGGRNGVALATVGMLATAGGLVRARLYRSRECTIRAVETTRIARAVLVAAALALAATTVVSTARPIAVTAWGAAGALVLLLIARATYRSLLMRARRQGRHLRPVVIVGTNSEGRELVELVRDNPAFGYEVVGVVGTHDPFLASRLPVPWLGDLDDLESVIDTVGATGAIVAGSALGAVQLNNVVRGLLEGGHHVQLSSGLRRFDQRRVLFQELAYVPVLYLEPSDLSRWQRSAKRSLDVVVSIVALVLAAPVFVAAAIAVRCSGPGPVLFRQTRIGLHGRPFTLYKLRTMVVDAEDQVLRLMAENERNGPLFKIADDPRRTRVGKFLERTSLDELPQLFNVVRGEMSLVGPRPALGSEVAQFDDELLGRLTVKPGVTGIWQLEARDDPNFETYRRLDLFYVENWSLALDVSIVFGTVADVVLRGVRSVAHR